MVEIFRITTEALYVRGHEIPLELDVDKIAFTKSSPREKQIRKKEYETLLRIGFLNPSAVFYALFTLPDADEYEKKVRSRSEKLEDEINKLSIPGIMAKKYWVSDDKLNRDAVIGIEIEISQDYIISVNINSSD